MMQVVSAIFGGITDLSFHAVGYMWQILNCFLTAAYSVHSPEVVVLELFFLSFFLCTHPWETAVRYQKSASIVFYYHLEEFSSIEGLDTQIISKDMSIT
jgi:hypothetical protein